MVTDPCLQVPIADVESGDFVSHEHACTCMMFHMGAWVRPPLPLWNLFIALLTPWHGLQFRGGVVATRDSDSASP